MEAWLTVIGEYGFPIAITFYLLYRIERKLDTLNQSVVYLGRIMQNFHKFILETKSWKPHTLPSNESKRHWNEHFFENEEIN